MKPAKCSLFQKEVKFLDKIVNADGVSVDPKNVKVVQNWPVPKIKKDLESFIEFTNYQREHVKQYAPLLHELTGGPN